MSSPIANWRNKEKYRYLGRTGRIISFTRVNNPPKGFGKLPYYIGIIEFNHSQRKSGQLVLEGKKPKIGVKVMGIIRRIGIPDKEGIINYGIKFKLI